MFHRTLFIIPRLLDEHGTCQASRSQSFNFPCSTRCFNFVQADAISLELQQIEEQLRMLEEFEVYLAEELGISAEDIDSVRIFLEVKNKALQDPDYSLSLGRLRKLHHLRLQYCRAQRNLPVDLEVCPSPLGVSRNQSSRTP